MNARSLLLSLLSVKSAGAPGALVIYAAVACLAFISPVHAAIDTIIGGEDIHQGETRRITLIGDGIDFAVTVVPSDARIGVRLLSKKGPAQLKPKGQITLEIAVPINFSPSNLSLTVNIASNFSYPIGGREIVQLRVRGYPQNGIRWRPLFHFAPLWGWMNDPAGLFYINGTYHLYYRAIPFSHEWHVSRANWGHAVSTNLINWSQRRDAVFRPSMAQRGDDRDQEWSPFTGSAVVFGGPAASQPPCQCPTNLCVASIFTIMTPVVYQDQWLATSCDGGETFNNPERVLPNVPPRLHFRDPKVFLHGSQWVMVLAAGDRVELYGSSNLKQWGLLSFFPLYNFTALGPFVENAELLELPVAKTNERKWVLLYGEGYLQPRVCEQYIKSGAGLPVFNLKAECTKSRNLPSRSLYIVGQFDGIRFTAQSQPRPLDFGPDFYAAQTWFASPGRQVLAGWQNNWQYADRIPTAPWRGQLSIPRELGLIRDNSGAYWLTQRPVREVTALRNSAVRRVQLRDVTLTNSTPPQLQTFRSTAFDVEAVIDVTGVSELNSEIRIHLRAGSKGQGMVLTWRRTGPDRGDLSLTRSDSETGGSSGAALKDYGFVNKWPLTQGPSASLPLVLEAIQQIVSDRKNPQTAKGATLPNLLANLPGGASVSTNTILKLRILVDRSSVEIFAGDGQIVFSSLFFPDDANRDFKIYASQGSAKILSLDMYGFDH